MCGERPGSHEAGTAVIGKGAAQSWKHGYAAPHDDEDEFDLACRCWMRKNDPGAAEAPANPSRYRSQSWWPVLCGEFMPWRRALGHVKPDPALRAPEAGEKYSFEHRFQEHTTTKTHSAPATAYMWK